MTLLERRLSKLEASILPEARPGTGKVMMVRCDREGGSGCRD